MTGVYKTPGVYIVEKPAQPFPNSVVEVATAVPAFIGYTEVAQNNGKSLLNKPWRVTSMIEFQTYFGQAPVPRFTIEGADHRLTQPNGFEGGRYLLYRAMQLFFQNGGGACYIVSVGDFSQDITQEKLIGGINTLKKEQEPTMLVVPDGVLLEQAECIAVQQAMLKHCGDDMRSRFAILDIWGGDQGRQSPMGDPIAIFRDTLGTNFLNFGAAYYPWLNTTLVEDKDIDESCIKNLDASLTSEQKKSILNSVRQQLNLMPPSAAMAGIYTMVDNARGVWKAPANITLNAVVSPAVSLTQEEQVDLNVTLYGKSINAIRSFAGQGVLVWGARTLDGNSQDWRYINVRRTMIMLEQSIKLATEAYVFEPNAEGTWLTIKSTLTNFLTDIWKRGGLAGATPENAFKVEVGVPETMQPQNILDGILIVSVFVAISHPAEFIMFSFQQQMQKS
jgi:uncharacterized protein